MLACAVVFAWTTKSWDASATDIPGCVSISDT